MNASGKRWWLANGALSLLAFVACTTGAPVEDTSGLTGGAGGVGGSAATGGMSAAPGVAAEGGTGGTEMMGGGTAGTGGAGAVGGSSIVDVDAGVIDPMEDCPPTTCKELGVGCGKIVDKCGNVFDCATEGLTCGPLEVCTGGADVPASCQVGGEPCDLCHAVEDCSAAAQPTTLVGRVITPGRDDTDHGNQVGVPNAFVYITRNKGVGDLPAITAGIPEGGTACDRCEDQVAALGPVLVGTVTDATGAFKLAGNVPVGEEFSLVVKAGRFRRAIAYTVPPAGACTVNMLPVTTPDNPTRLPRDKTDGLAVSLPHIAVSTGQVDAMECVLEKMGISHDEFKNPDVADASVHLYVGGRAPNGDGARIDTATPFADALYGDAARLNSYDIVLSDCEGQSYDRSRADRDADGDNVIDYVNRGGRLFASHLNYTWLDGNGTTPYSADAPEATGLGPAATWDTMDDGETDTGIGAISMTSAQASPRIQSFADWMSSEAVATAPDYTFDIVEPRSQNLTLGTATEEFVATTDGKMRVQQFSFNTPYAAPAEGVCGRVAYSGFHVSVGMTSTAIFPNHCTGDLTKQEKVLLYMLFDLSACVGETPPPPPCEPDTCESLELKCGFSGDGCGDVLDCGPCPLPIPK